MGPSDGGRPARSLDRAVAVGAVRAAGDTGGGRGGGPGESTESEPLGGPAGSAEPHVRVVSATGDGDGLGHGGGSGSGPSLDDDGGPGAADVTELVRTVESEWRLFWSIAAGVMGKGAEADDVVQDSVVIALERWSRFESGTNCRAWLARIVRFTALNRLRRQRRQAASGGDVLDAVAARSTERESAIDPRGDLLGHQASFDDATVRALGALDPRARACLLLRVTQGLSFRELGRVMDMPEGTAMSHVHRARRAMRAVLGADGGEA